MAKAKSRPAVIVRSFDSPDGSWSIPGGAHMEILEGPGGIKLGRGTAPPGWRWSEHVGPLEGAERCEMAHRGIILSGREVVRMADGTEVELKPGDVFFVPAGHDAWIVGDEPCVSLDLLSDS